MHIIGINESMLISIPTHIRIILFDDREIKIPKIRGKKKGHRWVIKLGNFNFFLKLEVLKLGTNLGNIRKSP